jgi:DNA-binding NarL/FixJ family response regulator
VAVRILIVDDHDVVRRGVQAILSKLRPAWEICGEATNGKEAIQTVGWLRPDIVILDITMPVMSGLEAASHIAKLGLHSRILIFTMHESGTLIADVRKAGAHGCVQKSRAARDLIVAIETLLAGGTFFGSAASPAPSPKDEPNPNIAWLVAVQP